MNKKNRNFILAVIFLCAAMGFLLPFWPLEVVAVIGAALLGHVIFAILLGVLLDLAYGAPTGLAHYLFFPFTLIGICGALLRLIGKRYLLPKTPPEHL